MRFKLSRLVNRFSSPSSTLSATSELWESFSRTSSPQSWTRIKECAVPITSEDQPVASPLLKLTDSVLRKTLSDLEPTFKMCLLKNLSPSARRRLGAVPQGLVI